MLHLPTSHLHRRRVPHHPSTIRLDRTDLNVRRSYRDDKLGLEPHLLDLSDRPHDRGVAGPDDVDLPTRHVGGAIPAHVTSPDRTSRAVRQGIVGFGGEDDEARVVCCGGGMPFLFGHAITRHEITVPECSGPDDLTLGSFRRAGRGVLGDPGCRTVP